MKKRRLIFSACLCLCLLAGCGAVPAETADGGGGSAPGGAALSGAPAGDGPQEKPQTAAAGVVCRIVSGAAEDDLLLAKQDGGESDVYRLPLAGVAVSAGVRDGDLVEVGFNGNILETFPAQLGEAAFLTVLETGFDDRCRLYLDVLEDLWAADEGLNGGITELGVDLSATSLSPAEQSAVAWAFGQRHGLVPVQGTYGELVEQGYITGEPLEGTGAEFWQWEDGCLFSITETDGPVVFGPPDTGDGKAAAMSQFNVGETLAFDAEKWRSGLGAYFFSDCSAVRDDTGHWGGYTVGSEAIA